MEFIRALKKRKANPPDEGLSTEENSSTGSFFYNLFFGSPSKSNKSCHHTPSKKRTQDGYYHSSSDDDDDDDDDENKENQNSNTSTTKKKKKRTTSKYPHLKKQQDEIKKMKDSIQSLGSSSSGVDRDQACLRMTPKQEFHSTCAQPNSTPQSRGKKKSLLGHLLSFTSSANESPRGEATASYSLPTITSPNNNTTTTTTGNHSSIYNVKISEMTKQDLDRMKGIYRSPLYTNTPPKKSDVLSPNLLSPTCYNSLQQQQQLIHDPFISPTHVSLQQLQQKRQSTSFKDHGFYQDGNYSSSSSSSCSSSSCTHTTTTTPRSSMESILSGNHHLHTHHQPQPHEQPQPQQQTLSREQSSSSGFSTHSALSQSSSISSSCNPSTTLPHGSSSTRPLSIHHHDGNSFMRVMQETLVPQYNYVFNFILFRGSNIKNSGNGFKDHSNVYAVVEVGSHKKTSSVVQNSSNPVWNEQFQLMFQSPIDPFSPNVEQSNSRDMTTGRPMVVSIRLYDHDEIFEHEFLGKVEIPLNDLILQCGQDTGKLNGNGQLIMKRSPTIKDVVKLQNVECGHIEIQYRVEHHVKKSQNVATVVKYNFF
ncbi:hypothetical protein FDP41_005247 [Naegleria fowleri]|uniref:C2 domain-containing protein n=1 Tax=Naegleria fowleri TaxID=5763 RepID=A0A6A5BPR8_NAEFO|nr:uncharacterized protein FDP41_005247 [Naegleria fowleri]KAF0975920.1 hypothetical protein FDP41_005247 [Naegleria fowleri]CAG4713575.1 unnamed protein product [Naegleria fowleri]